MQRTKLAELATRLNSVSIHLVRRARTADTASGVPPGQLSALSVLVFGGERTIAQLAEAEHVTSPTMTRIVDVHFPGLKKALLAEALEVFFNLREVPGLKKKPSTSELLDWLKLLLAEDIPLEALHSTVVSG